MDSIEKFKIADFEIKEDLKESKTADVRIVKAAGSDDIHVKNYELSKLSNSTKKSYAAVKAKFGPLAATDPDRIYKSRKDSRFALNPLLRDPLSIETEERRVIEERVIERVKAIEKEAKEEAIKIGFEEGLKRGHDEAFKKFRFDGIERLKRLDEFIQSCESAKADIFRENERFLIEMVYRISKMVILKEVNLDKEFLLRVATELIKRVGVRENIRIRINTEDSASIEMIREGLVNKLGSLNNLNIEVSNQIKRGGCSVETEWNAIDANIDSQLQGIYEALFGKEKASQ